MCTSVLLYFITRWTLLYFALLFKFLLTCRTFQAMTFCWRVMGSLVTRCLTWFQPGGTDTSSGSVHKRRAGVPGTTGTSKKLSKISNPGLLSSSRQSSQRSFQTYLSTDNSTSSSRLKDAAPWGVTTGVFPASPFSVTEPQQTTPPPGRTFWTKPPSPPPGGDGSANPPGSFTFLQTPAGYQQEMDDVREYNESGGGGGGIGGNDAGLMRSLSTRMTSKNCDSASPKRLRSHRKKWCSSGQ